MHERCDHGAVVASSTAGAGEVEEIGDTLRFPKIGNSLTLKQQLQVHPLIVEFQDVFNPKLVPGDTRVEPMEIEIKPGWSVDQPQPMRK